MGDTHNTQKKTYIMALDQGTTSSRCILFDKQGNICSMAQKVDTRVSYVFHNDISYMNGCSRSDICQGFHAVIDPAFGNIGSRLHGYYCVWIPFTRTVEVTIRVGFVTSFSP